MGIGESDRVTPTVDLASIARSSERELEAAPTSDVRPLLSPDLVPWLKVTLEELRELPLDPRAAFLVSLIDGQCSIEMLADVARVPEEEAMELFAMLLQFGAIEVREAR